MAMAQVMGMANYREVVTGDMVLHLRRGEARKEIVDGMMYEVGSKVVNMDEELGLEKKLGPPIMTNDIVLRCCLLECPGPLSKEDVSRYKDAYTARVVEYMENNGDMQNAESIRKKIHLVKEYLLDEQRFPNLKFQQGSDEFDYDLDNGYGLIVFQDDSDPSLPPKFLFLRYGLQLRVYEPPISNKRRTKDEE